MDHYTYDTISSPRFFDTAYRGLGNAVIKTYGRIQFTIKFRNQMKEVKLLVVPDNTLPAPILLGRDGLKLFGIELCNLLDSQ